ncbi:hypothetical protein MicB006_1810 [Micromonospora sp. B006]|nr:hypothetical protein MicB006_1810 [Micromonospora sp. B006]
MSPPATAGRSVPREVAVRSPVHRTGKVAEPDVGATSVDESASRQSILGDAE